jgi:hypothetical protein
VATLFCESVKCPHAKWPLEFSVSVYTSPGQLFVGSRVRDRIRATCVCRNEVTHGKTPAALAYSGKHNKTRVHNIGTWRDHGLGDPGPGLEYPQATSWPCGRRQVCGPWLLPVKVRIW